MMKPRYIMLVGMAVMAVGFNQSQAQSTWDGGGSDANWDTAANWDGPDVVPGVGDDVIFATSVASGSPIDLNGNRTVGTLTLGDGGIGGYTVGDGSDTLTIQTGVNYTQTAGGNIGLNPGIINVGTNNTQWNISGGAAFNVQGDIQGSGTIDVNTNSPTIGRNLRLSGNNSGFTGNWNLGWANLNIESSANAGTRFGVNNSITFLGNGTNTNQGGDD